MHRLYMTHFSLANDLYSYGEEVRERDLHGEALINGVQVLKDFLHVPTTKVAKKVCRQILWDIEVQSEQSYMKAVHLERLNNGQLRFA